MFDAAEWEDYWRVGPVPAAMIYAAAEELGFPFPADFVELMSVHQGRIPPHGFVPVFEGPKTMFGPLMHFVKSRPGELAARRAILLRHGYPVRLVPFADAAGQCHWALDYRASAATPKISFVIPELGYDDEGAIVPVASSISELLTMLEDE